MRLDRWWEGHHNAGRFATVTLDCTRQGADAQRKLELRWKAARDSLQHGQVPDDLLDDMGERLTTREGPGGPVGRVLVADVSEGRRPAIVLDLWFPEPPDEDTTCCGPLPDLRILARAVQRNPAYVTVSLDRTGADLAVHPSLGGRPVTEHVDGDHDVVHKVRSGDSSHQRMQRRAEDSWQHNAAKVADRLSTLCRTHQPVAVLLSGDEHACAWLRDQSGPEVKAVLVPLPAGRSGDVAEGVADRAVRTCLDTVIAGEVERALADFLQNEGRQDRAAQGRGAVSAALRRGQVARLLLVDPSPSSSTVEVGQDGLPTAAGSAKGEPVTTATAMLAGAAATGADVTLVPEESGLVDGVAAVLRWSDAGTPRDSARSMPGRGEGGGW